MIYVRPETKLHTRGKKLVNSSDLLLYAWIDKVAGEKSLENDANCETVADPWENDGSKAESPRHRCDRLTQNDGPGIIKDT